MKSRFVRPLDTLVSHTKHASNANVVRVLLELVHLEPNTVRDYERKTHTINIIT
jgi:hypothetical protein